MSTWNKKNFSIYTSDERSALGLIEELGNQTNYNTEELEKVKESDSKKVSHQEMQETYKLDKDANFTGSWYGIKKPTASQEGLQATVDKIVEEDIPFINEQLEQIVKHTEGYVNLSSYRNLVKNDNWTIALQTALDTGKSVLIEDGTYNIESVILQNEKQAIIGYSREATLKPILNNVPLLVVKGLANSIKDISIKTDLAQSLDDEYCAIKCENCSHLNIYNVYITGSFTNSIKLISANYTSFFNSFVYGASKNCLYIKSGTYTKIDNTMINYASENNVLIDNAPSVYINKCHITRGGNGIKAVGDELKYENTYLVIKDCDIDNLQGDGINIDGYWNVHVKDNWISACRDTDKCSIRLTNCKKICIKDNDCYASNQGFGIYADRCTGGNISGNVSEHHIFCIKTISCSNLMIDKNTVCAVTALPEFGTINSRAFEDDGNSITCKWNDNILINPTNLENFQGIQEYLINHFDKPRIIKPSLMNNWVNVEYRGIGCYIDSNRIVHLFGEANGGINGATAFNLPAGFSPGTTKLFGDVMVKDNGEVQFNTSSSVNLNGINYLQGEA